MRNKGEDSRGNWATFAQAAREDAGLSKAALARLIDVDRATVGRWEAGESLPASGLVVAQFARATGVSENDALKAAGVISSEKPPALPASVDLELRVIRESDAPEHIKQALIDYVHRRRAEQTKERMEAVELALKNQQS